MIWREQIESRYLKSLAPHFPAPHAKARATLFLAVLAGFQLMHGAINETSLRKTDPKWLVVQLTELLECLRRPIPVY